MNTRTRPKSLAAVAAALLAGLLALPLIAASPAAAQARDISNACEGAPESDFPDRGNEAQAAAIDCIAGYGITQGKADGTYGTGDPIQRQQMATFLVRKILLVPDNDLPAAPAENQFPCDVRQTNADGSTNPHYESIQRLAATTDPQIAQGGPGGQPADCFGPTQPVRRGQMATFIVRQLQSLGVSIPTNSPDAFDDDNGTTHEANINIVADLGIAQGTSVRRFQPNEPTTRGQMAFFLSRDLSVLVANDQLTNPFTRRGVTALPELTRAAVVSTTPTGQATAANPAGTRVRFVFDKDLGTGVPAAGEFFVHAQDNTRFTGAGTPTVESGSRSVLVNFPVVTTEAAAANLTLAAVDDGAVRDTSDNQNPEGDAPLGTQQTTPDAPAGVTTAPDLLRVENPRAAQQPNQTAVDFVFDQAAFRTTGTPGDFALIMTDGTENVCTAPASGDTDPSGETSEGGEGTNTFTVVCDNPPADPRVPLVPGPTIELADIARGTVAQGAVAASGNQAQAPNAANQNPLQASNTPDVEGTDGPPPPDLVSVAFTAGSGGARDAVVYTFDQELDPATIGNADLFAAYRQDGREVAATAPGGADNPTVNPANTSQIRVTFPNGTLTTAVGGNVRDGAVTGTAGGANEQDEEAATLGTTTTRTPGRTTGPNLTDVALSRPNDVFGNPGDFQATYTFDESVTLQQAAQAGAPSQAAGQTRFYLFTSTGTRLTSTACSVGSTASTNSQVTCTAYDLPGGGDATSTQIGETVLGTVDFAAVFGAGGAQGDAADRNPEGARATSGGTGSPSS